MREESSSISSCRGQDKELKTTREVLLEEEEKEEAEAEAEEEKGTEKKERVLNALMRAKRAAERRAAESVRTA